MKTQFKLLPIVCAILILICALIVLIALILNGRQDSYSVFTMPNDDFDPTCVPIVWKNRLSEEQMERIHIMKQGWFDRVRFPSIKITAEERSWLFKMRTIPPQKHWGQTTSGAMFHSFKGPDSDYYEIHTPLRIRKEYRQLSSDSRNSYHNTINKMKTDYPFKSNISAYDFLIRYHRYEEAPTAHYGASFLPWHRQYLIIFENVLFHYGFPGPGLPYWDSTLDETLPDPSVSALWTPSYMGDNSGEVTSDPAKGWNVTKECQEGISHKLKRNMTYCRSNNGSLFSDANINDVYSRQFFKDISCGENCAFEYQHGAVHECVGGQMSDITCSPNDPIFFMHHAFIDCVWEEFRQHHQKSHREREYPSHTEHKDPLNEKNDENQTMYEWYKPMRPFDGLIHADGLSDHYTNFYYQYQSRPIHCSKDVDCHSDILWCNTTACRCSAKVREGSDCIGLTNNACACFSSGMPQCNKSTKKCECIPQLKRELREATNATTE